MSIIISIKVIIALAFIFQTHSYLVHPHIPLCVGLLLWYGNGACGLPIEEVVIKLLYYSGVGERGNPPKHPFW